MHLLAAGDFHRIAIYSPDTLEMLLGNSAFGLAQTAAIHPPSALTREKTDAKLATGLPRPRLCFCWRFSALIRRCRPSRRVFAGADTEELRPIYRALPLPSQSPTLCATTVSFVEIFPMLP
jgi:hypothetical protein